jgi:alpha-galactosidase
MMAISITVGKEEDMAPLRTYALLVFLLTGMLACSLTSVPATPTATVPASPTTQPTDTPAPTATEAATATPAPTETAAPSETPDALFQSLPQAFLNLQAGVTQYFNPVGQPAQTWNGIPIMPQASAGQEFQPGAVYSFKAAATIAQGVSFYKSKMTALGYSLNGEPSSGSGGSGANAEHDSFIYLYKGSQVTLIYVASYDSDPGTIMVVISTQ